jgi:hypothetical protein
VDNSLTCNSQAIVIYSNDLCLVKKASSGLCLAEVRVLSFADDINGARPGIVVESPKCVGLGVDGLVTESPTLRLPKGAAWC